MGAEALLGYPLPGTAEVAAHSSPRRALRHPSGRLPRRSGRPWLLQPPLPHTVSPHRKSRGN